MSATAVCVTPGRAHERSYKSPVPYGRARERSYKSPVPYGRAHERSYKSVMNARTVFALKGQSNSEPSSRRNTGTRWP